MRIAIKPKDENKPETFLEVEPIKFKDFPAYSEAILNDNFDKVIELSVKQKIKFEEYPIKELGKLVEEIRKLNDESFFAWLEVRKQNTEYFLGKVKTGF